MAEQTNDIDPNRIVLARRTASHAVSIDFNELVMRCPAWEPTKAMLTDYMVHEGDLIPMRFEEAEGREDFEPTDEPLPVAQTAEEG